ncbi:MAG: EamA family transporter [Solirubrobacteraceae bacterium]
MSHPPARTVWIALTTVYIAWGSTYVAIRLMDRTIPPLAGAGVRFLLAGFAMYGFLALRRRGLPRVAPRELASLIVVSILLLTGGNGIVTVAERHVPAGLAALLVASMPLWVLLLRLLAGDRPRAATLVGLGIGFSGVALLVLRGSHGSGASVGQALVVVAGALAWATGSFLSSRLPLPADVSAGTAVEMIIGGAVLAVLAVVFGEPWSHLWLHASADSLLALVYLAAIGSIVAFTAYVWLLQNVPISKISTYAYVNPVVAVALGALVLGEAITGLMVVGGLITVAAVAVVIRSESRASSDPAPVEPPPPALALEGPAEAC